MPSVVPAVTTMALKTAVSMPLDPMREASGVRKIVEMAAFESSMAEFMGITVMREPRSTEHINIWRGQERFGIVIRTRIANRFHVSATDVPGFTASQARGSENGRRKPEFRIGSHVEPSPGVRLLQCGTLRHAQWEFVRCRFPRRFSGYDSSIRALQFHRRCATVHHELFQAVATLRRNRTACRMRLRRMDRGENPIPPLNPLRHERAGACR